MDPVPNEKIELVFKVMRITRPSLAEPIIITNDHKDLPGVLLNNALERDVTSVPGTETIAASSFLVLPQSVGQIYLGETFSIYICIHNRSKQLAKNVTYQAALQIDNTKIALNRGDLKSTDLEPECSISEVINHEVKEFGKHFLMCEVKYCFGPTNEKSSFTKCFKFEVLKPLDVKTMLYTAVTNAVFVEVQVQNITSSSLVFEKVSLESPKEYKVTELNTCQSIDGIKLNVMASEESKKFLYCLTPVQNKISNLERNKASYFGKLDIVWRSHLGERGWLQTCPFHNEAPQLGDLHITVEKMPNVVFLEELFEITFSILNTTERRMDMILLLEQCNGFAWCGISGTAIGSVAPRETTSFVLKLVPLSLGLLNISGVKVKELFLNRIYEFNNISEVFVTQKHDAKS